MKAVAFDFDGALVFSEKEKFSFLQKTAKEFGIEVPDNFFNEMVERTTKEFIVKCLNNVNPEKINKVHEIYEREYKRHILDFIKPVNATTNFIKNYKGNIKFAVVSGSDLKIIEKALKAFDLFEKVNVIVSKQDVDHLKPDPEPYLLASKRLMIDPTELYVIEDSQIGARSALNAKTKCFIFLNTINNKEQFKNLNIEGFLKSTKDMELNIL